MLVNLICNHNGCKLSNSGEQQISMKRFFVPGFTTSNTKTVFEMVDRLLNIDADFIGLLPFLRTTLDTRIGTKIFFGIDVNHPSTGRSSAGSLAVAYTSFGFIFRVVFPFHFGTHKLHGWDLAF